MSKNLKPWLGALAATAGLMLMAAPFTYARDFGMATATCGDISIEYSPTTLWPPNHKMRTITIQATDNGDSANETTSEPFSITVQNISDQQSEARGEGCGNVTTQPPDWSGVGNTANGTDSGSTIVTSAQVRGERCAREGDRTYDIQIACTDENGTNATTDLLVTVPKHRHH